MQSRKYAVTGGIGSGKSYVLGLLAKKGYPVFSCDAISRELWGREEYRAGLLKRFPTCEEGGEIGKEKLSQLVFSDEEERRRLNAYAHPRIMEALFARMEREAVSFAEVPLLFEEGLEGAFDGVIAVYRDREARIRSILERDGCTREEAEARMRIQFDPARLSEKKCFVLENGERLSEDLDAALKAFGLL